MNKALLQTPEMKHRLSENGFEPEGGPPERVSQQVKIELERRHGVSKAADVKINQAVRRPRGSS